MKCDHCEKEAVVHEMVMKQGVKSEVHLCAEHASASGYLMQPLKSPLNQVLTQFVVSQAGPARGSTTAAAKTCPGCGVTLVQFRRSGVLGCPQCYEAFEAELGPLIERAHAGATHHVGKTPARAGGSLDRQLEIRRLVQELDRAIAAEQYERAAEIRDRLLNLDAGPKEPRPASGRGEGTSEFGP